ncbi:pilus assembly protein [Massilia antarctica]|uniref:pilus assembly protein n=1 Tax=Massilia antarctica TaxID=2765360 RepID=UPI0006BD7595|nr:PilC/PilY family type IV pilus protein [Massilia sp. H27-R4]MCY0912356.1 PilC/PilY family type IV pilus protein [Massilia sp. H27-R4]CUI03474.1 Type IV fimbrial biogenesis protein PilY1 [Janthinobacterium sp. CG23_2]CUU27260.1 Type IV fimbrial biogenesis protein PilY1 [Janthinobacterium sp. CG23_2]
MQLRTKIAAGAGLVGLAAAAVIAVRAALPFVPSQQPIGYVGQPVASSTNVSDGKARMFSIDYNAASLTGNLHAFPIGANGTLGITDTWTGGAAGVIAEQVKAEQAKTGRRNIVTISDSGAAGIPFTWAALTATQRAAIDPATAAVTGSAASPILNYLRGDNTGEGTTYRKRNGPLGTIIHSTPVYWKDSAGNETVYVGANDGMMHAIDAVSGKERFAYIPGALMPRLAALSNKAFTPQYYVDGRLDVRQFGAKTVLIGTLGGGGKSIFALDVTNGATSDEAGSAAKVMWEVTENSAGFANLGDTYGAPVLTRLLKKKAATVTDKDEFYDALVIGNGYNNKGSGVASLYVIDAQTGKLIKEYTTTGGSMAEPNGLSSPSLWDNNEDGVKDTAYAGDINGNMWKFNLNDLSAVPELLHKNEDAAAAHAITTAPGLARHPNGGVLVAFVTGRLLTPADAADGTTVHYAYGIRDLSGATGTLVGQTLSEVVYGSGATAIRTRVASNEPMDWTKNRGWKVALPKGERVVGDGIFITGEVFQFFSTNPTVNTTAKPPGENWWMQLNWRNGGSTGDVIFDLNGDSKFTSQDMVKVGDNSVPPVGRHMGGGVRSQLVGVTAGEIDVYQSNFDQNDAQKPSTVDVSTATVGGERGVAGGHFDTDIFCYAADKCGGATTSNSYTTGANTINGMWAFGREKTTGAVADMNYVHVHEYDDIYDVLGLNMLHPSLDEQRLAPVVSSTTSSFSPDLANYMATNTGPATATVVSTGAWESISGARKQQAAYSNFTEGTSTAGTATTKVLADGTATFTSTRLFKTTRESLEVRNESYDKSSKRWSYDQRVVVTSWTTTETTVDTIPNTRFKVLVANQANSPAINFSIDGADSSAAGGTYKGNVTGYQTSASLSVATMPAYKMNAIKDLQVSMPLDAFVIRDWANNGILRNGVHPIRPQCAGVASGESFLGKNGEWRNGALTVQVVKDTIAQSDVQLNVAGRPDLGYRLTDASLKGKLIAEYLIYWHHPTTVCMHESGWTYAAPPDNSKSTAKQGVAAAGALDPKGSFQPGTGDTAPPTMPTSNPTPVSTPNADGSITTTTVKYTALASGGYVIETTVTISWPASGGPLTGIITGGAVNNGSGGGTDPKCVSGCVTPPLPKESKKMGRINWRELQR